MNLSSVSVILPSLDPDEKLLTVIDGLLQYGFTDIILVNDGSKQENLSFFQEAAKHPQVHLLHHERNRGKGAALKTAFQWFLDNRPDGAGIVTVDGDNQHHPADTRECAQKMLQTHNLILGVRDFSQPDVPFRSRNGNQITAAVFRIFVGMRLSDTQTGLRAIPKEHLSLLCSVKGDRFEYETNMLLAMKTYSIAYEEVNIRTVYIEENKSSHFRAVRDSWRIYKLILSHFFLYTLSSLLSFVVDEGLFLGFTALLHKGIPEPLLTAIPVVTARILSSLMNFYCNKKLVFRGNGKTSTAFVRYVCLALPTLFAQFVLTYGSYLIFNIEKNQIILRGVIYAAVMIGLFFVNFFAQQRWVFHPENTPIKHKEQ